MRGIFWLASYPKSGNTWVRVFLSNLRRDAQEPVDINDLDRDGIFSGREIVEDVLAYPTTDLTHAEVDQRRRAAFNWLGCQEGDPLIIKVHDAFTLLSDGKPLIPVDVTRGAIYVVRNPLDVAPSFADHLGVSLDGTIRRMAAPRFTMARRRRALDQQTRQRLLSWSGHVASWLGAPFPVHVVRYEDLKEQPLETFGAVARFVELPTGPERLARAVRFSEFSELRRQEEARGFKEKSPDSAFFFRKGVSGAWRDALSLEQARAVASVHAETMYRMGYGAELEQLLGQVETCGRAS